MNNVAPTPAAATAASRAASIGTALAAARAALLAFIQEEQAALAELPDNPRIRRLGGNCFVARSSDLRGAPFDPFYHDHRAQYARLAEILAEAADRPATCISQLTSLLATGKERVGGSHGYTRQFAPAVLDAARPHLQACLTVLEASRAAGPQTP